MSNPAPPDGCGNGRKMMTLKQIDGMKDESVEEGHDDANNDQDADATPTPLLPQEAEKINITSNSAVKNLEPCSVGLANNIPITTITTIEKVSNKNQKNATEENDECCAITPTNTTETTEEVTSHQEAKRGPFPLNKTPPKETAIFGLIKGTESTFDLTTKAGYCGKIPESVVPGLPPLPPQRSSTPLFSSLTSPPPPRRTITNSQSARSRSVSPLTPSTDQRSLTSSPIRFTPDSRTLGYTTPPIFPPRSRSSPGHAIPPIVLKPLSMDAEPLLSTAYDESTGQISSLLDVLENLDEPISLLILDERKDDEEKQLEQQQVGIDTHTATSTAIVTSTTTAIKTSTATSHSIAHSIATSVATDIATSTSTAKSTTTVTATPTPTITTTAIPTPTITTTATVTAVPTAIPTPTLTTTATAIPTQTITATATVAAVPTPTPTMTATATAIPTQTITATATVAAVPTPTPTMTATATAIPTPTITTTATAIPTLTNKQTRTKRKRVVNKKPLRKTAGTQTRSATGMKKRKLESDAPLPANTPAHPEDKRGTTSPGHIDAGVNVPMDVELNEELDLSVVGGENGAESVVVVDDNTSCHDESIVRSRSPSVESSKMTAPLNEEKGQENAQEKEQEDLSLQQQQQQQQRRQPARESINTKTKKAKTKDKSQEESSRQLRSGSQSKASSSKQSKSKLPSSLPISSLPPSPLPSDEENSRPDQVKETRRYFTRNRKPRLACNPAILASTSGTNVSVPLQAIAVGPSSSRPDIVDERGNEDVDEDADDEDDEDDEDDGYEWDTTELQKYARKRSEEQKALDRELAEVCIPGDAKNKRKRRVVERRLVPREPNTMGRRKNAAWRCPPCLEKNKVVWLTSTKAHKRHNLKVHVLVGSFKCEQCKPEEAKSYKTKDDLKRHLLKKHARKGEEPDNFECRVCDTLYGRRAEYNRHFDIKKCNREKRMRWRFVKEKMWMFEPLTHTGSESSDDGGGFTRVYVLPKRLQPKTPQERAREREEAKKARDKAKKIPYAQLCQFDEEPTKTVRKKPTKKSLSSVSSLSSSKKPTKKSKPIVGKKTSAPKANPPIVQRKKQSRRHLVALDAGDGNDDATADEHVLEEKEEQQSVATKSPSNTPQRKKKALISNMLKIQPRRNRRSQREQDSNDENEIGGGGAGNEKEKTSENVKKRSKQNKKDKGNKK